nr:phage tail domain-containing protein [uncultured Ligilactobacillus sp.]
MSIEKLYIKKDGENEFEINEKISGIEAMGITKVAPQLTPKAKQIVGSDGELTYSAFYGPSTVKVKVFLAGRDVYDYKLLVSELYRLLYSRKPIRIHDEVEPNICYYVFVKPMTITTINFTHGTADIEFTNPSGFRYSIKNSDELAGTDYQYGMNETNNDEREIKYRFNSNNFWVYNDSDIDIDPYINRHELKITLTCNGKPQILNKTTETSISVNKNINKNDTFVLNGVDSFLNGNDFGINTDLGYITLAKGWNNIQINGASDVDINFSFPFIYL